MRSFPVLFLSIASGACGPASADIQPIDTVDDTDVPVMTEPQVTLSGVLTLPEDATIPPGDITVVALSLDEAFSSFEVQASVNVGAVAAGGSSAFTLSLPEELPDDLFFPDEESPEMEVAAFMVGAYIDADGDGEPGRSDPYVGLAVHGLVGVLRGTLSEDAEADGAALGWNFVVGEDTVQPFAESFSGLEVEGNMLESAPIAGLPLHIVPSTDLGPGRTVRVDLHSSNAYFGIEPAAPTLASVVVDRGPGNLDATLPFPLPEPPDDHFTDDLGDGPYGAEIAIYSALAYVDEDGDGRWSGNVYTEGVIASSDAVEPSERITVFGWSELAP